MNVSKFEDMIGVTMVSVTGATGGEDMCFTSTAGDEFHFYHGQDCCEHVEIEDICGDLSDLCGTPILGAEETTEESAKEGDGSGTWTFYRYWTAKGTVTVRWYGSSNGYYSETADYSVTAKSFEMKTKQALVELRQKDEWLSNWLRGLAGKYELDRLQKEIVWLRADLDSAMSQVPGGWRRCRYDNHGKRCTRPDEHWLHGSPEHVWEQ